MIVNIVFLTCAMFLDPNSIMVIFLPTLFPVAAALGIDPVHFGMVVTLNVCTGMIMPPLGLDLAVAASTLNRRMELVVAGIWPFIVTNVAVLILISYIPPLSTFLPRAVRILGEVMSDGMVRQMARRFAIFMLLGPLLVWLSAFMLHVPRLIRIPDANALTAMLIFIVFFIAFGLIPGAVLAARGLAHGALEALARGARRGLRRARLSRDARGLVVFPRGHRPAHASTPSCPSPR